MRIVFFTEIMYDYFAFKWNGGCQLNGDLRKREVLECPSNLRNDKERIRDGEKIAQGDAELEAKRSMPLKKAAAMRPLRCP
jgi:hypothetical protein